MHIDCAFSAAASCHCHTSVQPICVLTPCPCRAGTYDSQIRKWIKDDVGADVTAEDANMTELGKRLINKCALRMLLHSPLFTRKRICLSASARLQDTHSCS